MHSYRAKKEQSGDHIHQWLNRQKPYVTQRGAGELVVIYAGCRAGPGSPVMPPFIFSVILGKPQSF